MSTQLINGSTTGSRWPAIGMVVGGAVSVHSGAAVAVLLFPRAGALGVVTLRLAGSAIIMLLVCRPRLRGYSRSDWTVVAGFGATLAAMNTVFYQAIERIPLGVAVTLEVLGPLALSVITSRKAISWLWAGLALIGVVILSGFGFDGLDPLGVIFALSAGVLWATYILLSGHTGQRFPKADGLAIALAISAVLTLPAGLIDSGSALWHPVTLGLGLAVAVLSSTLPYTLELVALRTLPSSIFAILMSLGPAIAAAAGFFILSQQLTGLDAAAIALVIAASAGAVWTGRPAAAHPGSPPAN